MGMRSPTCWSRVPVVIVAVFVGCHSLPATAQDGGAGGQERRVLQPLTVIGAEERLPTLPGAGHVVDAGEMREQSYDDVNRALRRVPGVYIREEDGFGIFPNISLRGVDTSRSSKVTLMEDGVLTAPAPYSAPAAYHNPATGRMSSIEVLKGSSQVRYGPHTTGGVINYQSTPIPREQSAFFRSQYGTDNDLRTHGYFGNTFETEIGRIGILGEGFFRTNDGFKTIGQTPDFRDGDDTGFTRVEPMFKLAWEPDTGTYQRFEFKYGRTDLDANETYLGLSERDFSRDPFRRYAASRFDNITTTHERVHLRHYIAATDRLDLTTTAYYTSFHRNWFKLHDINVDGDSMSLSSALAGADDGSGLEVLKGQREGDLRVRNNNRDYGTRGLESIANYDFTWGDVHNELTLGARFHHDYIRRFQRDETFTQEANGTVSDRDRGVPGGAGDRRQETDAYAGFVQNRMEIGRWSVTPGIRYEHLRLNHEDNDSPEDSGKDTLNAVAGGVGVTYRIADDWTGFGGVHRGISTPSPRAVIKDGLEEETSLAYELGTRFRNPRRAFTAETTAFLTRFDDLIVIDNIGAVGTGETENLGKVRSYGLELSMNYDLGLDQGWETRVPMFLSATYTKATLRSDTPSEDPESIFSFGDKGNDVPYIPDWQLTAGIGLERVNWGFNVTATYVDKTFGSASNERDLVDGDGNPDARFGETDSYVVTDLTGYYEPMRDVRIFAGAHNLFDREYIVSRQPHGPRPGKPRFLFAGMEMKF